MDGKAVTTNEASKCLKALAAESSPIVAAKLADKIGLTGSHETKRRHIRAIVKQLRDKGSMIVAVGSSGYFLTEDEDTWKQYLEDRSIDAKRILGESHKRKKAITDNKGQHLLFKEPTVTTGWD